MENNNLENQNKNEVDVESLLDKKSKELRENVNATNKKSFWDLDLSWIILVVLGLTIFGIAYGFQQTKAALSTGYVILFVIISFILGVIIYGLGKIIFGLIGGYNLGLIECLGFNLIRTSSNKYKFGFDVNRVLEAHIIMSPKSATSSKRPLLVNLGGLIMFVIIGAILYGISYVPDLFSQKQALLIQFGIYFALVVPVYELLPLSYSTKNDTFIMLNTRNEEDAQAYNNFIYNKLQDRINGEVSTVNFDDYSSSREKPLTLLPLVIENIYKNDNKKALSLIDLAFEYQNSLLSYTYCELGYQKIYLLLMEGRSKEANDYSPILDKKVKNAEDYHLTISSSRADILISALIENSLESTKDSIDIFTKIASKFEKTSRVEKEVQLVNSFIPKINAAHPDWKLKLLDIDNLVSKKEEKQSNEDEY